MGRPSAAGVLWSWAALPADGAAPAVQDQIDLADLCLAQGLADEARLLMETAFLAQGFSGQLRRERAHHRAWSSLWDNPTAPVAPRDAGRDGVAIAFGELRAFARATAPALAAGWAARTGGGGPAAPHRAGGSAQGAPAGAAACDPAGLAHLIFAALAEPGPLETSSTLDAALQAVRRWPGPPASTGCPAAPLATLATAVGLDGLRRFALETIDLSTPPLGSATALQRSAQFDSAGLGPYFSAVGLLARSSRDIRDLAFAAADETLQAGVETGLEPWIALLCRRTEGALLDEVIDDLGDAGAAPALALIFEQVARRPASEAGFAVVARLRDAALDNLDYDLAARAQAWVVRLRPDSPLERMLLGSIDASAGRTAAAEQSFLAGLAEEPGSAHLILRLDAVRAGRFEPFAVRQGFGSPPDRQAARLRRRQAS